MKKNWLDDVYAIFPIFLFVTFLNKIIFKIPIDFKKNFWKNFLGPSGLARSAFDKSYANTKILNSDANSW